MTADAETGRQARIFSITRPWTSVSWNRDRIVAGGLAAESLACEPGDTVDFVALRGSTEVSPISCLKRMVQPMRNAEYRRQYARVA